MSNFIATVMALAFYNVIFFSFLWLFGADVNPSNWDTKFSVLAAVVESVIFFRLLKEPVPVARPRNRVW